MKIAEEKGCETWCSTCPAFDWSTCKEKYTRSKLRQFLGRKVIITPNDGIPYEPEVLTEYHLTQLNRWDIKVLKHES